MTGSITRMVNCGWLPHATWCGVYGGRWTTGASKIQRKLRLISNYFSLELW